jgi:hypothetical protein
MSQEFRFLYVRSKAAGKSLAKAFGTRLLPAMYDNDGGDLAFVLLPQELNQFFECYTAGLYPELTNPSALELRLYELQSELDMRDFADRFRAGTFWRIATGIALIVLGLWFTRHLLRWTKTIIAMLIIEIALGIVLAVWILAVLATLEFEDFIVVVASLALCFACGHHPRRPVFSSRPAALRH